MKKIKIVINQDGTSEIDLSGYRGNDCHKVTEQLLKATKGKVLSQKKKNEFYLPKNKQEQKHQYD